MPPIILHLVRNQNGEQSYPPAVPVVRLSRLPDVPIGTIRALLNDLAIARHLPLEGAVFDHEATRKWVEEKDAQWERVGYGPWAIHLDGQFAGWGGFQKEGDDADFALVLKAEFWGSGLAVYRTAMHKGFLDFGFDSVVVTLPPSRRTFRLLARLGYQPDGEAEHAGKRFLRFRLSRRTWSALTLQIGSG